MILKSIISQSNYTEDVFDEQPITTWGSADTGDYTTLTGVTKVDIFTPTTTGVDTYNHGGQIIEYYGNGVFHAVWYNSALNEPSATRMKYSKSIDYGLTWTIPVVIFEYQSDVTDDYEVTISRQVIPSSFVPINDELYMVVTVSDLEYLNTDFATRRIGVGCACRKINSNGTFGTIYWIENVDGTFTAPTEIATFPVYTFNTTLRSQVRQYYTDNVDKQPTWWHGVPNTDVFKTYKTIDGRDVVEPSVVKLPSGQYLKLWRTVDSIPLFKWAQTSNYGFYWSDIYETDIPDMPSKTDNITDGNEVILVGNNGNQPRDGLFLSLSSDGLNYTDANTYDIDRDDAGQQFTGFAKGGGCQYPSIIKMSDGRFMCIYSVRKEIIRVAIFDKPTLI